ncbi:hypothetical protein G6F37_004120 [Rhizopus arrhizus]|nr:hypothetical protein G6F38_001094 [Rhizopus arrhizus]KAG1160293.1 hypothetical protein G6F37_004120 [Rhizopus arrhizus]
MHPAVTVQSITKFLDLGDLTITGQTYRADSFINKDTFEILMITRVNSRVDTFGDHHAHSHSMNHLLGLSF